MHVQGHIWMIMKKPSPLLLLFVLFFSVNGIVIGQTTDTVTTKKVQLNGDSIEIIFVEFDHPASFPGGEEAMYRFLSNHIVYPEEAIREQIEGTVLIEFVVKYDGTVTNARVDYSESEILAQAALDVVKHMPRWNPAMYKGKAVNSQFMLPVYFRLDSSNRKP